MGKATVVSEIGKGQYVVDVDYGSSIIALELQRLDLWITAQQDAVNDINTEVANAEAAYRVEITKLNNLIDAYADALKNGGDIDGAKTAVQNQTQDTAALAKEVGLIKLVAGQRKYELKQFETRRDYLLTVDVEHTLTVWGVDYLIGKKGEVATIEVPGEPGSVYLAPLGAAHSDAYGDVIAREAQDPNQVFYNAAILPGWQKFMPTYRIGTITAVDYATELVAVTLDAAYSSADGLNINQSTTLEEVPVTYMACGAAIMEVNDRVVVQFEEQDWEKPRVIGFEDNPKPCGLGLVTGEYYWYRPDGQRLWLERAVVYLKLTEEDAILDKLYNWDNVEIKINDWVCDEWLRVTEATPPYEVFTSWIRGLYPDEFGTGQTPDRHEIQITLSRQKYVAGGAPGGTHIMQILYQYEGVPNFRLQITIDGVKRVDCTFTPAYMYDEQRHLFEVDIDYSGHDLYPVGPVISDTDVNGDPVPYQSMTISRGGISIPEEITHFVSFEEPQ